MALKDKLDDYVPKRAGGWCHTCQVLKDMPDADAKALRDALENRHKFASQAISKILADEGYYVGASSLERHRRGDCKGD